MVSLQTTLSPKERPFYRTSAAAAAATAFIDLSKKRKRDDPFRPTGEEEDEEIPSKELKLFFCSTRDSGDVPRPTADVEFQLEDAPLPPDWQRCLDIESGQITFYNTRTRNRTTWDPRRRGGPPRLSLDLNLACDPQSLGEETDESPDRFDEGGSDNKAEEEKEETMVAAVCMRCHMLVMMSKSSPSCPNCKFLHPQAPSNSRQFQIFLKGSGK